MQTRKEGGGGSKRTSRQNSILPKPKLKLHQGLVQAEATESCQALPTGSRLDVKRDRLLTYRVLWQTHVEVRRPQAHTNAHQQRPTSLSSQTTARETAAGQKDTYTAHTQLHQTHGATWKRPLSSLLSAQLTGEPVPTQTSSRHRPRTQGLPGQGSPHCPLFSRGPPAAAVQLCFCQAIWGAVPCAASYQCNILPGRLPAHRPPLKGWLCASCLQRKKTVFAAEQHSLEPSIEQWTPKATSTRMPHPTTQNACR